MEINIKNKENYVSIVNIIDSDSHVNKSRLLCVLPWSRVLVENL
jgi:hypothetical protein